MQFTGSPTYTAAQNFAEWQSCRAGLPAGGGVIVFPEAVTYEMSEALFWDDKPIILEGQGGRSIQPGMGTILKFPAGSRGVHSKNGSAGLGGGSGVYRIRFLGSDDGAGNDPNLSAKPLVIMPDGLPAHGVLIQANGFTAKDSGSYGFGGDGWAIKSITTGGDPATAIPQNANCTKIDNCTSYWNRGHGFSNNGGDSNTGVMTAIDAVYNQGYGYYGNAYLGAFGFGAHFSGNRAGALAVGPQGSRQFIYGFYKESDPAPSIVFEAGGNGRNFIMANVCDGQVIDHTGRNDNIVATDNGQGLHFNRLTIGDQVDWGCLLENTGLVFYGDYVFQLSNKRSNQGAPTVVWQLGMQPGTPHFMFTSAQGGEARFGNNPVKAPNIP